MSKIIKTVLNKLIRDELGQAMPLVLVLLLIGGLIIGPLMGHMSTGLRVGGMYEEKMDRFYAADSGIEDALWHAKYNQLLTLFPDPDTGGYYPYDYYTQWTYDPSDVYGENVNNKDVDVTIENVWVPKDITAPSKSTAKSIIDEEQLIIAGSVSGTSEYLINISYYWELDVGEPDYDHNGENLEVEKIGIWLPPGFQYAGNCSLEGESYYSEPTVTNYASGKAVIWTFSPVPKFIDFPSSGGSYYPVERTITFDFSGPANTSPDIATSWIDTTGVTGVDYFWDANTKVYKICSEAKEPDDPNKKTTIEAYSAKGEIRKMGSAVSGDYFAIGNSLIGGNLDWPNNYHYQLYNSSQASISTSSDPSSGIPASANIKAAYLYWTGWIDWHNYNPAPIFYDNCDDFNNPPVNWTAESHWQLYTWGNNRFRGQGGYSSGNDITSGTIPLGGYSGQPVTLSLDISDWGAEGGDYLYYQFYNSSGWSSQQTIYEGNYSSGTHSVTIPEGYLTPDFRMRFTVDFNRTNEYVYLDNITISSGGLSYPSNPSAENIIGLVENTARVNKVLFNDTPITADTYQVLYPDQFDGTSFEGTWFYTAMVDVTELLYQWIEDEDIESNGAGDYTLGHYYIGTNPSEDDYRVNAQDPSYSFNFYSGGGSTGYPLGTPSPSSYPDNRYTAAHAGWSLLTIYSSPETYGHQLYLYDIQNPKFDFFFGWRNNADFDNDGNPGGTISGFLVPDKIAGETLAGRITVFVGEGDKGYIYDYFRVNGVNMSNTSSPSNNVWNSDSPGLTVEGVDIDHFDITWASGILDTGDTSVQIDIPTGTSPPNTDGFSMVYIIFSFRSETTSGGAITYLVRD